MRHSDLHRAHRTGWLRAAVLGANDGIVSTSSLVIGVAAAHTDFHAILVNGTAGDAIVVAYFLADQLSSHYTE